MSDGLEGGDPRIKVFSLFGQLRTPSASCSSNPRPGRTVHRRLSYSNLRMLDRLRRVSSPSAQPLTRCPRAATGEHSRESLRRPITPPRFALWLTAQVQVPSTPDQLETQERGYCRVGRCRLPHPSDAHPISIVCR
jgi:hypothetical protein